MSRKYKILLSLITFSGFSFFYIINATSSFQNLRSLKNSDALSESNKKPQLDTESSQLNIEYYIQEQYRLHNSPEQPPVSIEDQFQSLLEIWNSYPSIRNKEKFTLEKDYIPIVLYVYQRTYYYKAVLESLKKATGIEKTLLIISHDGVIPGF